MKHNHNHTASQRVRFFGIFLALTLLLLPGQVHANYTTQINPSENRGTWEGWGCSLAWWANVFGTRDDIADVLFTTKDTAITTNTASSNGQILPGLGMNIARYNAGGCTDNEIEGKRMVASPNIPAFKQIEGYWRDWYSQDPTSASWRWSADATQRAMLLKARDRGANLFELFSNSPLWWMCNNSNPSGSASGTTDNLQAWNHEEHAIYLATVAKYAKDNWGITFNTVAPFNEPIAGWWREDGTQEGCYFSTNSQASVIGELRTALNNRGLQSSLVAASDESKYDMALDTWNSFNATTRAQIGQVNVHGYQYGGGRRDLLRSAVGNTRLWNSEYGEADSTGMELASNLNLDFEYLRPTAWCYWQPLDSGGWGLIRSNPGDNWIGEVNPKYFVLAQYSRHIRPGMTIINGGSSNTIAAYDQIGKKLVIVTTNYGTAQSITHDLSAFSYLDGPIRCWTTQTGAGDKYALRTDLSLSGKSLTAFFPANTVQTFEIPVAYQTGFPWDATSTTYEAESGTRNGTAVLENGGQYVGNLGNGLDNWVEIRNVNVPTAGTYRIAVSYASGDNSRALTLRMNGNDSTRVTQNVPNTGGWNTTGTIIYEVVLQSGINIIRFYNANTSGNTYAPPVDKISVPANPSPAISASGTLAAVNTIFPNASPSPTSFNVAGTNLTTGITVTAPTRFEVSTAVNGTYAATVTIAGSGTISSTPVFVRLAANTPVGTHSGNLVLSSPGATSVNVATVSSSVTTWTYSFGDNGNVTSFSYNGSTMPNVGVSVLTKNGVTSASSDTGNFFASNWGTGLTSTSGSSGAGGSLNTTKYFEFTITASQGFTVTNPAITFGLGRNSSGPRRFEWRSSLDNYATAIPVTVKSSSSAVTLTNNMLQVTDQTNSRTGNTVSLTTSGQSQITFRFYAYGAEGTGGTGGLAGNLTFTGTLVENPASPMITANGTMTAVNTTYGTASTTTTSFTLSGADMTEGITVTPPAGFEVSTSSTFASGVGNSASPITIGSTGTIAQTTVYVRLAATAPVGAYSGNLVLSSTGATSVNVATVSSVVSKATPTITADPTSSAITFGQSLADSTLSGGAASVPGSFAFTNPATTPNAGTASQGVTFTPTDAANYNTATGTVSVTVNKATPTIITAPTASAITFGQTLASSTLSGGSASTAGSFAFTTPATAPNAGTASQGVTFTPTDSVNYNTATGTVNVTVAPRNLTITGLTGTNKVYDRSTSASASGTAVLDGVLGADIVALSGTPVFAFVSSNVGTGIAITTTGYTLSGTNAANYSLTQPSLNANITAKELTITGLTGVSKIYDGSTDATANGTASLSGVVGADDVALSGTPVFAFVSADVGTGISITASGYTLSGLNAGNYTLAQPSLNADITAHELTVTGLTGENKIYDGNVDASASGVAVLNGVIGADDVILSGTPLCTFASANVGVGIAITATGYKLSGADAANYFLIQPSMSANITAHELTITGLTGNDKPHDGNTHATASGTAVLNGVNGADEVILSGTPVFTFASAAKGTDIAITTTGYTLTGAAAGNYLLTLPSLRASIFEDPLFANPQNAPRVAVLPSGGVRLTFQGIPGRTYSIQRSTTMHAGSWTQIHTVTAGENAQVTFDDPEAPAHSAFYRVAIPAQ